MIIIGSACFTEWILNLLERFDLIDRERRNNEFT
jgi:hypothetical protein